MRFVILFAASIATGLIAPPTASALSTCENICKAQGELARYQCRKAGGSQTRCHLVALQKYRSCVMKNCWGVDEDNIKDPYT